MRAFGGSESTVEKMWKGVEKQLESCYTAIPLRAFRVRLHAFIFAFLLIALGKG